MVIKLVTIHFQNREQSIKEDQDFYGPHILFSIHQLFILIIQVVLVQPIMQVIFSQF